MQLSWIKIGINIVLCVFQDIFVYSQQILLINKKRAQVRILMSFCWMEKRSIYFPIISIDVK